MIRLYMIIINRDRYIEGTISKGKFVTYIVAWIKIEASKFAASSYKKYVDR
jgi:hypothetical protein